MQNHPNYPQSPRNESEQLRPPVTRWNLPAPRLQGVRFESPIAKVPTVNSPLRPSRPA
jgi:hypothetical protein